MYGFVFKSILLLVIRKYVLLKKYGIIKINNNFTKKKKKNFLFTKNKKKELKNTS